ncbi:MAG: pyruvate:ferredoxin (flavodoxin) oxidoreductase [Chloroflexi bacterium]|nr:pyruvate:ferredoxin (flavodoxin) oxidoreductase [Chloroflexota bacterium]
MPRHEMDTIDGNTAAASVAHAASEVIAIYPITPSSPMGETADELSAKGETNIWGTVPQVTEMQSEAGAAGAVHGALSTGALVTTFTASQGLLLMVPNMFKIAGELIPTVFHVSARALAAQALSIFGDHSDVMAVRSTGFALLASNSVQEVGDMALVAHAATLEARVPFLHFFDGFRTSHEVQKVEMISKDQVRAMIDDQFVLAHRARRMTPDAPVLRGTAQNPDVYFAGRETGNKYYAATPEIVQRAMDRLAQVVGRQYHLFDYVGAPDAERVVIMMGSGAETMHEVVEHLVAQGEKVGLVKVRLFRPFDAKALIAAVPTTVKSIAVLDRTKEPGSLGEPLYVDVCAAVAELCVGGCWLTKPTIVGGRYGLGSFEFTAGMAKSVLDNLKLAEPKNHFTVGIVDDVTFTNLPWDESYSSEPKGVHRAMFFGLGSDGTVSANKNSIKIIGDHTDNYAQGYFYYDSKKAGGVTVSHLRFGKEPIRSSYLLNRTTFVACHNFSFLERIDMLRYLTPGGTFLLASPYDETQVWDNLPAQVQQQIIDKKAKFYTIDAVRLAKEVGLGARINTIMQTAFFVISGVLEKDEAIQLIKDAIVKSYGKRGQKIIDMNFRAVDTTVANLKEVQYPHKVTSTIPMRPPVPEDAPEFVKEVLGEMIAMRGDQLPVSKLPDDGTYPTGTTQFEKRNVATEIPVWRPDLCIQCGTCAMVCPHATIRIKAYDPKHLEGAPATFKSADARGRDFAGKKFTVQVAPEDCTGCGLCVGKCPVNKTDEQGNPIHAINLGDQIPLREPEAANWAYFLGIPDTDPKLYRRDTMKGSQFIRPLFEFSGACAGCGETPYVRLLSQLVGDRLIIANATGCSSIYGGNLPTTPYTKRDDGRGPTWSNSLFEDAAEFGMGMRLTVDKHTEYARELLERMYACECSDCKDNHDLFDAIKNADQSTQDGIEAQRGRVDQLKEILAACGSADAKQLLSLADYFVNKSVWVLGGDGWAYDIGYGGLDHVIASGRKVNILVMDTGVYSNTGGQMSKATPLGAVAKFAAAGKRRPRKDLGMMAMNYGSVYVAQIAMGANPNQTVRAFAEAEAYDGPSLIIAYSHCITGQGIGPGDGLVQQQRAVDSGAWLLYRYNPALIKEGKNPLALDSKAPKGDLAEYMYAETRFRMLRQASPEVAAQLLAEAKADIAYRYNLYKNLAAMDPEVLYSGEMS